MNDVPTANAHSRCIEAVQDLCIQPIEAPFSLQSKHFWDRDLQVVNCKTDQPQ